MFKIPCDCHIKTCLSLKRRAILKMPTIVFRGAQVLSIGFRIKPLRKSAVLCYDKNHPHFAVKLVYFREAAMNHLV